MIEATFIQGMENLIGRITPEDTLNLLEQYKNGSITGLKICINRQQIDVNSLLKVLKF